MDTDFSILTKDYFLSRYIGCKGKGTMWYKSVFLSTGKAKDYEIVAMSSGPLVLTENKVVSLSWDVSFNDFNTAKYYNLRN